VIIKEATAQVASFTLNVLFSYFIFNFFFLHSAFAFWQGRFSFL